MKWLSLDGGASIRPAPSDGQDLGPTDRWLLEHVNVTVVPPTRFDAARRRDEVRRFLGNGGTLLSMEDLSYDVASQVTALKAEVAAALKDGTLSPEEKTALAGKLS